MKKILSMVMAIIMCGILYIPGYAVSIGEENAFQNAKQILVERFTPISDSDYTEKIFYSVKGDVVITRDYQDKKTEMFVISENKVSSYMYADFVNLTMSRTDYINGEERTERQCLQEHRNSLANSTYGLRDYKYLGQVRYQYAAGSQYNLCGARVELASTVINSDKYNLAGTYDDDVALAYFIAGILLIPFGFAHPVAAAIISSVASFTGYLYSIKSPYYISAKTTTNNWKVIDISNSRNYDVVEGVEYIITEQGRVGDTYYDGDFWEKSAFTNRSSSFAYYIYPLLFSYTIFDIYDWNIA